MTHVATPEYWSQYRRLPPAVQALADKNFDLLRTDARHPSLRLKKAGAYWSARIGLRYRALAKERADGLVWFWIGPHDRYDALLNP